MDTIYYFLIGAIGIILAIGVGLEVSKNIEDFIIYVLFWLLYIITIITFINIILVILYYINLRNKKGLPGKSGKQGDIGDKGDAGKCDPTCRDSICENALNELLLDELKQRNQGVDVKINNVYLKSKIRQMCASTEFKQLAPYNGPINLINYLKDIWRIWISLLYNSGGILYFETIGAEDQFQWLSNNPFDELKKYDVFYWGMGKQYKPEIVNKCYTSKDGVNPDPGSTGSILQVSTTDLYDGISTDDNSQAFNRASFWRPKQFTYRSAVFYPVGDIVVGPKRDGELTNTKKHIGAITFPETSLGPARETILVSGDVRGPINYDLLWTNDDTLIKGNEQTNSFWIWRPIAPVGYIALGDVITTTANPPLTGTNAPIRCVPFDMVIELPTNGNVLWSSMGSPVPININVLGFKPNTGNYENATAQNAYNLFRGVVGFGTSIPISDINGNFYYLDTTKYDANFQIGKDYGRPDNNPDANSVGKGYIPSTQLNSKYSVIAYLKLKNNAGFTHNKSKIQIQGQLIPNAISNSYIIKVGQKCLNYDGAEITLAQCDEVKETQYFSILFTGNAKNECQIMNYKSGKILKYKNGLFTLIDFNTIDEKDLTLFTMD